MDKIDSVKCFNIKSGINLYYIPVTKFKTLAVSINFHRPLRKEEASLNALLADVMRRGSEKYPDAIAISNYLQELYGAYFDVDVRRKGEDQILSFMMNTVSDQYLPDGGSAEKALDMLFDMALCPLVQGGAFKKDYVEQEKVNLINDIEAIINDKRTYSVWRLVELMCEGDNYGVHELGTVEDVKRITPEMLYQHYLKVIKEGPIDIFVTGDTDIGKICTYAGEKFADIRPTKHGYPETDLYRSKWDSLEQITERFDVTQAKLCVGCRTGIGPLDDQYPALMVYNGILGSGAHSKLFNNVREKLSLAYYAASRLERFKGMMVISSGIEITNKQKALDEIFVQMDAMKQGDISDYEFDATIKSIVNSLRSLGDDIGYLEDYYLGQVVTGTKTSLSDFAEQIQRVTPEDVVKVAQQVKPELVYFLTAKGEGAE